MEKQLETVAGGGDPAGVAFAEPDAYVRFEAGNYLMDAEKIASR